MTVGLSCAQFPYFYFMILVDQWCWVRRGHAGVIYGDCCQICDDSAPDPCYIVNSKMSQNHFLQEPLLLLLQLLIGVMVIDITGKEKTQSL